MWPKVTQVKCQMLFGWVLKCRTYWIWEHFLAWTLTCYRKIWATDIKKNLAKKTHLGVWNCSGLLASVFHAFFPLLISVVLSYFSGFWGKSTRDSTYPGTSSLHQLLSDRAWVLILLYGRMGAKQTLADSGDKGDAGHASLYFLAYGENGVSKPIHFLERATGFGWRNSTCFIEAWFQTS